MAADTTYNRNDSIDLESLIRRPTRKEMQVEKERLLKLFESRVGRESDGKTPLNIALIGTPGVGKSSLINTFIASMSYHYEDYVLSGSFCSEGTEARQVTLVSTSINKYDYMTEGQSDLCLPSFTDIAGFSSEDTELCEELLRIVLYGCLPDGELLKDAEQYGKEHGMEALQNKYCLKQGTKVDRIIFVAGATEQLPKNLIRCAVKAAMPSGGVAGEGKRTIPIFGVLTKADAFIPGDAKLKQREEEFLGLLGLKGIKHHYALLSSYCDDVDKNNERTEHALPEIDVPALRLLTQVCSHRLKVQKNEETYGEVLYQSVNKSTTKNPPVVTQTDTRHYENPPTVKEPELRHNEMTLLLFRFDPNVFLYYGLILVVFINLMSTLAPVVEKSEFTSACARFKTDVTTGYTMSDNPDMENICDKKIEITKPVWLRLMGGFILIVMIDLTFRFTGWILLLSDLFVALFQPQVTIM